MWPNAEVLSKFIDSESGLTLNLVQSVEVQRLTKVLKEWYPDITVGMESCHLTSHFYSDSCYLGDDSTSNDKPVLPLLVKRGDEWIGFVTFEADGNAKSITSRLGVVNPQSRGEKIGHLGPLLLEGIGRKMGMGIAYYQVTLKIPHQQVIAEKMGFKLVGFLPAIDLDLVAPGTAKRVTEGVYAKVLAPESEVLEPNMDAMTPKTRTLYEFIFKN